MLVISSREFREKQKHYLDRIDAGEEILLQRGKSKTYKISPVTEDDIVVDLSPYYIREPDEDYRRAITGDELLKRLIPRIEKLFDK